ncbi:MAG: glycosyltransferase [Clostridia bacterium]|nr:glycosyltransferase [Clostridia bacterium]
MKVMQINCVYNEGSTGKITRDIHEHLLASGEESVVLCGRRAKDDVGVVSIASENYAKLNNLRSRVTGVMYGGCYLSTEKMKRIIRREKPDVVHLQCINGFFCNIFRLLAFLKASGIPTVLTLHAEFMYTANCSHAGDCDKWKTGCHHCAQRKTKLHSMFFDRTASSWKRMHRLYRDWDDLHVVACSNWIASRVSQSGEMAHRDIRVIRNGIDNDSVFYPREDAKNRIRERYQLPADKQCVLYVSPGFSTLKGFDLFIDLVHACADESLHFLLVGGEYEAAEESITVIGKVTDRDLLADLYSGADATVVCSRHDTYPTVCLEATSCGTPVVAFDVGGVRETIPEGMGGTVPLGDIEAMKALLLDTVREARDEKTIEAARYYHRKSRMSEEYVELYRELLKT